MVVKSADLALPGKILDASGIWSDPEISLSLSLEIRTSCAYRCCLGLPLARTFLQSVISWC